MRSNPNDNVVRPDHELKSWPAEFRDTWDGKQSYQWRKNDRDYGVGEVLLLREWRPHDQDKKTGEYTGREITVAINHMTSGAYEMPVGWCVLGILVLSKDTK